MSRELRGELLASLSLLVSAVQATSAQSSSSVGLSAPSSPSSSTGRASTEPSLSLPLWALLLLVVGGLAAFVVTLKLASCFYWMTEKQRVERAEEGLEEGRSGGVAPLAAIGRTARAQQTEPAALSMARMDHARKATAHISITQQAGEEAVSELSQWDSRATDESQTEAAERGTRTSEEGVQSSDGEAAPSKLVVVSAERE